MINYQSDIQLNQVVRCFDAHAWWDAGGDVGNNSCFWKPASIIRLYMDEMECLADVVWLETGRLSRGHFVNCVEDFEVEGLENEY